MICENCEKDHNGLYGSGRFCSSKCARGFSTKAKRKEINATVSKIAKERGFRPPSLTSEQLQHRRLAQQGRYDSIPFVDVGWDTKRKRIIKEQLGCCNKCGISEWSGKPITLEIDHINGINDDNKRGNLEGLCPNCHSVTDTWRGRNKPSINENQLLKVSDEDLIAALRSTKNIRQALLAVGLAAKGSNYNRAKRLLGT